MTGKRKLSEKHNEDRTKLQKLSKSDVSDEQERNEEDGTDKKIEKWESDSVGNVSHNASSEEQTMKTSDTSDTNDDVANQLKDDKDEHQKSNKNICEEQMKKVELPGKKGNTADTTEGKNGYMDNGTEEDLEKDTKKDTEKDTEKKTKKNNEKVKEVEKEMTIAEKEKEEKKLEKTTSEKLEKEVDVDKDYVEELKHDDKNEKEKADIGTVELAEGQMNEDGVTESVDKSKGKKSKQVKETCPVETKDEESKEKEQVAVKKEKNEVHLEDKGQANEEDKDRIKKEEENETNQEKTKKDETKKEETSEVKKEEIEKIQDVQTMQKTNIIPPVNDISKGNYMYGVPGGENKMYNMTMDNSYVNYATNYLEQYYNTTSNCYSEINKGNMYNAYHNQHSMNTSSNNNTTAVTPITPNPMISNVNDMKKGKKYGYSGKNMYETEYKMDDKSGNYAKMQNMYLNSYMNHPAAGAMPTHMVSPMSGNVGNTMSGNPVVGNPMNYPGPVLAPIPTAASVPASAPVPMPGGNMNTPAALPPMSNNPVDNYYMYNYNYMNNPNCSNYYYMYDNKGYEYHPKESESEKAYDFSAVIDKSLEIMKRNNKVKEILKHPARLQITPEELNKYEYTEGSDNYNIWFGKYVTDRYDKSAKHITRFVAKYKCNPQKDSGYTKADRIYNSKQFFCIYFARGCCAYGSNCLYKHRVPTENDELEFEHTVDIFGREKYSTYKDDMSGVGCFNSDCRTLFIGSVFINNFNDAPKVEKLLYDEFSNFGNVDYVRYIPNKNIAFVQYSNRVNAEFAKVAMSDQPLENHSTALTIKWAYEYKHPPNSYAHYYNTPYIYNQNQMISPTWGNYLMQQQYATNSGNNHMRTHMNGHPLGYPNSGNAPTMYTDYANMYASHYKKGNDRCNNINNNVHQMDQMYEQGRKGGTQ